MRGLERDWLEPTRPQVDPFAETENLISQLADDPRGAIDSIRRKINSMSPVLAIGNMPVDVLIAGEDGVVLKLKMDHDSLVRFAQFQETEVEEANNFLKQLRSGVHEVTLSAWVNINWTDDLAINQKLSITARSEDLVYDQKRHQMAKIPRREVNPVLFATMASSLKKDTNQRNTSFASGKEARFNWKEQDEEVARGRHIPSEDAIPKTRKERRKAAKAQRRSQALYVASALSQDGVIFNSRSPEVNSNRPKSRFERRARRVAQRRARKQKRARERDKSVLLDRVD